MATPLDWGNNIFDSRLVIAIKQAEGYKLKAYRDTEGYWTIGYGHRLPDGQDWDGYVIEQTLADQWFMDDLKSARKEVLKLPGLVGVDGVRIGALVELMFNMGPHKLLGFHKMWVAISRRDWPQAKAELLDSKWKEQVGEARANRIASLLETGEYQ